MRKLVEAMVALPLRSGIAAIDWLGPVEGGRSTWNGAAVDVQDVACGVGVDRVQVRQAEPCERCPKLLERPSARHGVPLLEHPAFLDLGKLQRHVLAVPHCDEWAVVGLAQLEPSRGRAGVGTHADLVRPGAYDMVLVAVAILCRLGRAVERLDVEVRDVGCIDSVRPGNLLVETDIRKRQTDECHAPKAPALVTSQMTFIKLVFTEELPVRCPDQHGATIRGFRWSYRQPVRSSSCASAAQPFQFAR